jgi:hypothetical protein
MTGIEIAIIAMMVIGTAAAAASQVQASNARKQSARTQAQINEFQKDVDERNALAAEHNRQLAVQQTRADVDDRRRSNRRTMGSIRAQYGASGIALGGSTLDVLADTAIELELDVSRTEDRGRVRSRESALQILGFNDRATLHGANAGLNRASADNEDPSLAVVGTLASGGGRIAGAVG